MTFFAGVAIAAMLVDPASQPSVAPSATAAATAAVAPPDGTYDYSFRNGTSEIGTTAISIQRAGATIKLHEAATIAGKSYTMDLTVDSGTLAPLQIDAVYPGQAPTAVHVTFSNGAGTETIQGKPGTFPITPPAGTSGGVALDGPIMSGFFLAAAQSKALGSLALTGISAGSAQALPIHFVAGGQAARPAAAAAGDLSMSTTGMPSGDLVIWFDPVTLVPDDIEVPVQSLSIVLVKRGTAVSMTATPAPGPTPMPTAAPLFTSRDVWFASSDGTRLAGTLTVPDALTSRAPAVLLVAGSGPVDRNETVGPNPIFLELSNALSNDGFIVLRYDKRGIGKSEGDALTWTHDQLASDARAAVDYLVRTAQVDPHRVFALGHSEGGLLVPSIAADGAPLRGIVLMAPPAIPLDQILVQQAMHFAPPSQAQEYEQKQLAAIAQIKAGTSTLPGALWLRTSFGIDPAQVIRHVPCPILILQGGKDFQVLAKDLPRLVDAAKSAHRDVTAHVYPNDDHLFITVPGAAPAVMGEYMVPHRVDPAMVSDLLAWLKSQSR
jgi:alpha-beta hydrolase superfamily lysophospholipase